MSKRTSIITALGFSILATSMVACGPGEEDSQDQPIDHATAQQNLTESTSALINGSLNSIKFIEKSNMFQRGLNAMGSTECSSTTSVDENGNTVIGDEECTTTPAEISFDAQGQDEEMNNFLKEHIFTQGNVETTEDRRIVYLLKGDNVCKSVEGDSKSECVEFFNKAEIRLDVTSPAPKALNIKLLVSANRHQPLALAMSPTSMAVTANLGDAKASAQHIATTLGEELPELPSTIEGTITAGIDISKPGDPATLTSFLEVNKKVTIADTALGYNLSIAPGLINKITFDTGKETIQSKTNMGAISALLPVFATSEGDLLPFDNGGDASAKKHAFGANIGGVNADITFDAKNEIITAKGLGLGDTDTAITIDGNTIFNLNINPNAGRRFDVSLKEAADDNMAIDIAPSLNITAAYAMAKIKSSIPQLDYPQWSLDDVFNVKADAATPVKLLIGDGIQGIKVLAGKLTINAKNANITHTVDANMCLLDNDIQDSPSIDGDGSDTNEEQHPLSYVSAQTCD